LATPTKKAQVKALSAAFSRASPLAVSDFGSEIGADLACAQGDDHLGYMEFGQLIPDYARACLI